jgi:ABC-2 type transport system permease protein
MRKFLVFTQKEFYHIFRDRWTMIILLVLPILMILLFGFGITTEIKNARFAVYDPSNDMASQKIIDKIQNSEYFTLETYLSDPAEIESIFQKGEISLLLVFSADFYENMVHTGDAQILFIADGTDPNTASTLVSYASRLIAAFQQEQMGAAAMPPYQIKTEVKLLYNPTLKGAFSTVPGVMGLILMLICAMMTSVSIAKEKELGTMEVILVSPMPPLMIIISKMIPYFIVSIINYLTILVLAVYVLDVPIVGSFWLLTGLSLLFIFVSLALGLLFSSLVQTQIAALLGSVMGLMLPTVLLSGLMFPIENMPIFLQAFAQIIPAKWFIMAVKDVMIKGLGITSILTELAVLSLMAVVLITISLKKFKTRLE